MNAKARQLKARGALQALQETRRRLHPELLVEEEPREIGEGRSWYTATEAAEVAGVSLSIICRYAKQRRFPTMPDGNRWRVDKESFNTFVDTFFKRPKTVTATCLNCGAEFEKKPGDDRISCYNKACYNRARRPRTKYSQKTFAEEVGLARPTVKQYFSKGGYLHGYEREHPASEAAR
jgi:excisionase family DNA binding protein